MVKESLKALSSLDERRVCQLASTGKYSTRKLIPTTGLKLITLRSTSILTGRSTRMFKYPTAAAPLDIQVQYNTDVSVSARDCSYACLPVPLLSKSAVKKQKGKNIGRFCLSHSLHGIAAEYNSFAHYHQRMMLLLFSE
ncbi:hypothetical protein CDAR_91001 [Caerostris darwini]|uniref:Uncharacterized protein n=1 Tax=Caerostris darwini TaxID=1538125 RepID=A0AAV4Q895_9ARAC|nr:hypothetical protein CDAR_91001 [Caerostris darwini]